MKNVVLSVVLVMSVAAHAALWWSRPTAPETDQIAPAAVAAAAAVEKSATADDQAAAELPVEAAGPAWPRLATLELDQWVPRLREAGFPPHLVRALVAAEVRESHRAELEELAAQVTDFRYWDHADIQYLPKLARASARLHDAINAEVDGLLGQPAPADPFREAIDRRRYGPLPSDVLTRLKAIESDYQDISAEIYQSNGSVMTPEDMKQLRYLEEEKARDFAELLTPEQLLEYKLRADQDANMLRNRLGIMHVTEEEFRLIYEANAALLEQGGGLQFGVWDPERQQAQSQALREAVAAQLPPERMALLEQALDPQMSMINNIAARFDLSAQVARDARDVQSSTIQEVLKLRNDRALSEAEKQLKLDVMRDETVRKLQGMLGPDAYAAYEGMNGHWLKSFFAPAPRPTPPGGG